MPFSYLLGLQGEMKRSDHSVCESADCVPPRSKSLVVRKELPSFPTDDPNSCGKCGS